jgi:uncharacterized protein
MTNPGLTDDELTELNDFLSQVDEGKIPNPEALDGFFAALACCPDLIKRSEYLSIIQSGKTEDGDLVFENMGEAKRFMNLVNQHWNYVNQQLNEGEIYLPLLQENEAGEYQGNDWANGFISGVHLRHYIWKEFINDEEHGGPIVPIWALAYENHPDPDMRPYDEPIDKEMRENLVVGAAAGVMQMYRHFFDQREAYAPKSGTFVRTSPKVGRNEPCPCGSGKKFKQCCGNVTLH